MNGLSSVLKSARTGIAVPFRVDDALHVRRRGRAARSSGSTRCARSAPSSCSRAVHVGRARDVLRALGHRLRVLLDLQVGAKRRRDALVEVEVEVPRLDVLVDVRQVHVRAVDEVVAAAEIDVAERLEVRDLARPHAGALRRGEAEKELRRVGDQVGAGHLRRYGHLLRQRPAAVEASAGEATADRRELEQLGVAQTLRRVVDVRAHVGADQEGDVVRLELRVERVALEPLGVEQHRLARRGGPAGDSAAGHPGVRRSK